MLKGYVITFYYNHIAGKRYNFNIILNLTKAYFKTDENRQLYMLEWREIIFQRVITANLINTRLKYLQLLFNKL
jgi:hypothetical protein